MKELLKIRNCLVCTEPIISRYSFKCLCKKEKCRTLYNKIYQHIENIRLTKERKRIRLEKQNENRR